MIGKIDSYEKQLYDLKKENMQLDLNVDKCIEKHDDDAAKVYLARQQEVTDKMEIIKNAIKELKSNSVLQKDTVDSIQSEIEELKTEKEKAILTLETAQVTKSLQASSASSREEDRMLEKVRNGVQKTKEEADGTRIAYESSTAAKQKRLDKQMKEDELQKKLDDLKAKRK